MKKILIVGDSFSSAQLAGEHGWPRLLAQQHDVTNASHPGIGQYKIMQRLMQHDVTEFDAVIISHTSPYRVHCVENHLYPAEHLYRSSDIIFLDAENKKSQLARSYVDYFRYAFDEQYYEFVHTSCCMQIDAATMHCPVIHITHFDWTNLYPLPGLINFYQLWLQSSGDYVHYNIAGNEYILNTLQQKLNETNCSNHT
jgi:hypothetical protein